MRFSMIITSNHSYQSNLRIHDFCYIRIHALRIQNCGYRQTDNQKSSTEGSVAIWISACKMTCLIHCVAIRITNHTALLYEQRKYNTDLVCFLNFLLFQVRWSLLFTSQIHLQTCDGAVHRFIFDCLHFSFHLRTRYFISLFCMANKKSLM